MAFQTINPATEEVLAAYELMSTEEVLQIAQKSRQAFHSWRHLSIKERAAYFIKLAEVLRKNKLQWGEIISKEMGKPLRESVPEVEKCALLAEVLASQAEGWLAPEKVEADGQEHWITFEPLGPIFLIMPWNFPFWQPFKVALPPLIAGNTIILKHARNVTGSSLAVEEAFALAGFPKEVFRSIIADHDVSAALIESDDVAACSLTGSVAAGSQIASLAGRQIKKTVLELGGSDPHLILNDADIETAARGAVAGRTLNAGQVCIGSKRIIVHQKIADAFTRRFAELMKELKIGDPLDPKTQIGPLVNKKAVDEMAAFITDAVKKGAILLAGGKRREPGFFFEPAVLGNVTEDMDAIGQETFGPIAPVIVANDDEEMVRIANSTKFGLSASIWSNDIERAKKIAAKIEAGGVFINSNSKSHPLLPLGGIKHSGYGRELSKFGIREFVNIKTINIYGHR